MVKDKKEVFICVTTVLVVTAAGFLSSYSSLYAAAATVTTVAVALATATVVAAAVANYKYLA